MKHSLYIVAVLALMVSQTSAQDFFVPDSKPAASPSQATIAPAPATIAPTQVDSGTLPAPVQQVQPAASFQPAPAKLDPTPSFQPPVPVEPAKSFEPTTLSPASIGPVNDSQDEAGIQLKADTEEYKSGGPASSSVSDYRFEVAKEKARLRRLRIESKKWMGIDSFRPTVVTPGNMAVYSAYYNGFHARPSYNWQRASSSYSLLRYGR